MRRRLVSVSAETIDEKVDELQKVAATDDKKTYHCQKKPDCDTSRPLHANPKVSLSSPFDSASIDA